MDLNVIILSPGIIVESSAEIQHIIDVIMHDTPGKFIKIAA